MFEVDEVVSIQRDNEEPLRARLRISWEPELAVSIAYNDHSSFQPVVEPLSPFLSQAFESVKGTLWSLDRLSWGVWLLTSDAGILQYLSGTLYSIEDRFAVLVAKSAEEVFFLDGRAWETFDDGSWRFAPSADWPRALLVTPDPSYSHLSGRMGRILLPKGILFLSNSQSTSLYFDYPQGDGPLSAPLLLQSRDLGLLGIQWNRQRHWDERYNLIASPTFALGQRAFAVLCSSETWPATPWTYELCLGHHVTERFLRLFQVDFLGDREGAVTTELLGEDKGRFVPARADKLDDDSHELISPRWFRPSLLRSGPIRHARALGMLRISSPTEAFYECEIHGRKPAPDPNATAENAYQENLRLCRHLAKRGLHPEILWPLGEDAGSYVLWQLRPKVQTLDVQDVPLVLRLLRELAAERIFPRGIRPDKLRRGEAGFQLTNWPMEGLVSTAAALNSSSVLETRLAEAWKRELLAQAKISAKSTAQDLAVFCALCLLWARSRDPSFLELLLPELRKLARELEDDIPEVMKCEVSMGTPRGRVDFLDGTVLALFWEELRAQRELQEKLQAADFWPAPALSHLVRPRASSF
jgi:hypothetical protein